MNFYNIKLFHHKCDHNNNFQSSTKKSLERKFLVRKNINKIMVKGISSNNLKMKIFQRLQMNHLLQQKTKCKIESINLMIAKLQSSGLFQQIILSYLRLNNQIYLLIKLDANPLIKFITVKDAHFLKIPPKDLKNLLKDQIGHPRDLQTLKRITNKIQSWYFVRGYRWSSVAYELDSKNTHSLIVDIQEGQINAIDLICLNRTNLSKDESIKDLILHQLSIKPGKLINYNNIELGMIKLKKHKLLEYCNYYVNKNPKNHFKITIHYKLLEQKLSYSFHYNIYESLHLLNFTEYSSLINKIKNDYMINQIKRIDLQYFINLFSKSIFDNHLKYCKYFLSRLLPLDYLLSINLNQLHKYISNTEVFVYDNILKAFFISLTSESIKKQLLFNCLPPNIFKVDKFCIKQTFIAREGNSYSTNYYPFFYPNNYTTSPAYLFNYILRKTVEFTLITRIFILRDIKQNIHLLQDIYTSYQIYSTFICQQIKYNSNIYTKHRFHIYNRKLINYAININDIDFTNTNSLVSNINWALQLRIVGKPIFNATKFIGEQSLNYLLNYYITIYPITLTSKVIYPFLYKFKACLYLSYFSSHTNSSLELFKFYQSIQDSKYSIKKCNNKILKSSLELHSFIIYKTSIFVSIDFINKVINFTTNDKTSYNITLGTGLLLDFNLKFIPRVKIQYKFCNYYNSKLYVRFFF